MDSGAISHNRRLERHSKHAARHPSADQDFTQARPAHLEARDAAQAIIREVEGSDPQQSSNVQRGLFGPDGWFDNGDDNSDSGSSGSGSNESGHGGNGNGSGSGSGSNHGGGSSSSRPTARVCTYPGPDGVCSDAPTSSEYLNTRKRLLETVVQVGRSTSGRGGRREERVRTGLLPQTPPPSSPACPVLGNLKSADSKSTDYQTSDQR